MLSRRAQCEFAGVSRMSANFPITGGAPRPARSRGDVDLDLLSEPTPATYSSEDLHGEGDTLPSVLEWLAPEPELMQALVIDPDRESRFYLRAKLVMADFLLTDEAATGGEALYLLKTRRYQLVIMDLDLPDIEGWQLAAKVGAAGGRPALADSIVLTRHKMSWLDELRARRLGAAHCLRKPLHPVELAQVLRSLN